MRIDPNKFENVQDQLEFFYQWTYVENEGGDTRYDWGVTRSMWLRSDGTIEGQIPVQVEVDLQEFKLS